MHMEKKAILIKNGYIHTMNKDAEVVEGEVLIQDGKIVSIGKKLDIPEMCQVIDAKEGIVMPGIIDAHNHIGIFEWGIGDAGVDGNEDAEPITPHLRAIDGIYPLDAEFKHSYENGVTCVATGPGSGNPIGGQFVAMKTVGKIMDKMILKTPLAMNECQEREWERPRLSENGYIKPRNMTIKKKRLLICVWRRLCR